MCKAESCLWPALCHAGVLVQGTKLSPSCNGTALSPSWAFRCCMERSPSHKALVLTLSLEMGSHYNLLGLSDVIFLWGCHQQRS